LKDAWTFTLDLKKQWEDIERKIVILKEELVELRKMDSIPHEEDCEGVLGYMYIPEGDGIPTKYYNNEMFDGAPINKVSELIDFDWQNDNPIEEINHDNYSIVFEGYVRSPFTARYIFTTFSDDGA